MKTLIKDASRIAEGMKDKNREYIVPVTGSVPERKTTSYLVRACSQDDARRIAEGKFSEEFGTFGESPSALDNRTPRAIAACILMSIAIGLSYIDWAHGDNLISIGPSLTSCLISLILYTSYVVRFKGVHRIVTSENDIALCLCVILLFASFVQTILAKEITLIIPFFKDISISSYRVLFAAVVLSWIGVKIVSAACFLLVGIAAFSNIMQLSDAMGPLFGPLYILSSFFGLLFYISVEPAASEAIYHIKASARAAKKYVENDFHQAGGQLLQGAAMVTGIPPGQINTLRQKNPGKEIENPGKENVTGNKD